MRFQICVLAASLQLFFQPGLVLGFSTQRTRTTTKSSQLYVSRLSRRSKLLATANGDDNEEAEELRRKAEELREQIRKMETDLGDKRPRNYDVPEPVAVAEEDDLEMTLNRKRVLVVGANGRLGSMVCRHLLRNNPNTEVVACVHYIGEDSPTSRGYGRLSYEVGAEDGVGSIGAAWSQEDRTATFEFAPEMADYNLQNLRLVECELLDPVQCATICEGVDSVVWCATDFNGNAPRAVSGLNIAFLFRAVADPTKGRVEIEGLRNMLGGLKNALSDRNRLGNNNAVGKSPTNFVLVSPAPGVLENFETPFGEFNAIKREGEELLKNEFPSLTYSILQMGRYDDNFVEEGQDIQAEESTGEVTDKRRRINRRDAARASSEALTNEEWVGKTLQVFTNEMKK